MGIVKHKHNQHWKREQSPEVTVVTPFFNRGYCLERVFRSVNNQTYRNFEYNGWLSELAFAPVDFNAGAMQDEWSGDFGVGCKYFSQDAVIKLAEAGGYTFADGLTPAQKLKEIQALMEKDDALAKQIYTDIGVYLAHTIPFYAKFYDIKHMLLLGRVMGGKGGDIILATCKEVLAEEYPQFSTLDIGLPDETNRRVGQSIAAASLPADRA